MASNYKEKEMLSDSIQKGRILIVDDDPIILRMLPASIGRLDNLYAVDTAKTGQEALEKIKQKKYTLLITDYVMPNMNGIEVAQLVHEISPETQIVLMTAYKTEDLNTSIHKLTLQGILSKPISFAQIEKLIQQVFERVTINSKSRMSLKSTLSMPPQPSLINEMLHSLKSDANARCVLLLSSSGHVVESVGRAGDDLDISSISALVAANFMAASELARMLGNDSIFRSSYYEGLNYDVYSYGITKDFLLAIIANPESRAGLVRFYATQSLNELAPLLTDTFFEVDFSDSDISVPIQKELDQLFGLN